MKLRKLLAFTMTAVLSLTVLSGCGSDNKNEIKSAGTKATSISEAFDKAAALEKYTFSGSFTMTASGDYMDGIDDEFMSVIGGENGITVAGTWEGKSDTKNHAVDANIGVSLGGKSSVKLIDYILVDGDAYIGLGTLADGIDNLLSEILNEEASIKEFKEQLPDGNYLKVSEETLKEIVDIITDSYGDMLQYSGLPITGTAGLDGDFMSEFKGSDEYKEFQEIINYFAELIVNGMKNGSDTCFTNDGDTYRMTINKSNINDIFSGILNEVQENSDDIAEKINSIAGEDVVNSEQLKQMAALFSIYDVASLMGNYDFSLSVSASYVDDTFKAVIAFAFSDGSNKMAISIENTMKKDDSLNISAPSDVISDEDAKPIIDEFMEGFRNGVDSSYGNITYDDFNDDWQYDDFGEDFYDDYYDSLFSDWQ